MALSVDKKMDIIDEAYQAALDILRREKMWNAEKLAHQIIHTAQELLADDQLTNDGYNALQAKIVLYLKCLENPTS